MLALIPIRGRHAAIVIAISAVVLVLATSVGSADLADAQVATAPLSGCQVFPQNNVWNAPIDTLPLDPSSQTYVTTIGASSSLHPDFGAFYWAGAPAGIPYVVVPGTQPKVPITFDYADESDAGPYPIPSDAPIEGGPSSSGDRHVLVLDQGTCLLYESWSSYPQTDGSWHAGSGAIFDLRSNALRPSTWTSADAAGLPILPGLLRYDEVASGAIDHAIRFTAPQTRAAYVWPARHKASSLTGPQYPPMGQRFRLKASFNISPYPSDVQVILIALKKYGMILADNGSSWYISGAPDSRWNDDHLSQLKQLHGSDFEAVDESGLMVDPNSGQTKQPGLVTDDDSDAVDLAHREAIRHGDAAALGNFHAHAAALGHSDVYPTALGDLDRHLDTQAVAYRYTHPSSTRAPGISHALAGAARSDVKSHSILINTDEAI